MPHGFVLRALLVVMSVLVGGALPGRAAAQDAAGPTIVLEAGNPPVEKGLKLRREKIGTRDFEGKASWISGHNSVDADEWARSFLITVTDPQFKGGKMPVVDIEVEYLHEANTKVELVIDSAGGSRVVAAGWGGQRQWQTLKATVNDAHFGARQHKSDPKTLPSDGYDIRINAWAGDFLLRSVKVVGHPTDRVDDWSRFLEVEKVTSARDFVVEPGGTDTLTFALKNKAQAPAQGKLKFELVDWRGKVLSEKTVDATLDPQKTTDFTYAFEAGELETAGYGVRVGFAAADAPDKRVLAYEQTVVVAGPNDLFVVFGKEPIARGIEFNRTGVAPVMVEVDGVRQWVWAAQDGSSHGADAWWKSILFTITDPRFRDGQMPAVDVTVNYRHTADAPVNLAADTVSGSRLVAEGWGRNEGWQSMRTQIDNARFASTDYDHSGNSFLTDKVDLRYNACNSDGQLRSIFIRGYGLETDPDYTRLLRFDGMDAGRELFIFEPGEKQTFKLKLRNLARTPLEADYRVRLLDDFGSPIWERMESATVAPGAIELPVAFDAAGLKQGVYALSLELGREGKLDLLKTQVNLMVSEKSPIGKARDGEFLYGLDAGEGWHGGPDQDERWLQWMDFMGVDILRLPGQGDSTVEHLHSAFKWLDKYNLRTGMMFTPGYAATAEDIDNLVKRADDISRQFGDRLKFYELGNEPDLTFFWNRSIEEYIPIHVRLYDTIKANDPDSIVMNGGLCFAGAEGDRRARRFIELVPADKIDGWAFHAHGPGAQSERMAYERIRDEAAKWGKADKPYFETESGVAARTPMQIRVQARTAIQKMVYAQSVNMPGFYWFRLKISGGDGDYTNVENVHEPRPIVLSYRTMVKTLRGHRFERMLDIGQDAEAYLFHQTGNEGGRALVLWANGGRGTGTRTIQLSERPGVARDARLVDMFGNVSDLEGAADGLVTVPVSEDPVFVTWHTSGPSKVASLPSPLEVAAVSYLTPGQDDVIEIEVVNQTDNAVSGTLRAVAGEVTGVTVLRNDIAVNVSPRGRQAVKVPVRMAQRSDAVEWPQRWTVFTDLPADAVRAESFTSIPSEIEVGGKSYKPQIVRLKDHTINLAELSGGYRERAEAMAFASLNVDRDRTIRIGSSADWWMNWFVNGKSVYSTLDSGNNGAQSILSHQFEAPVKAGPNLIVVRVLSGSQGWRLLAAGPDEVKAESSAQNAAHAVTLELRKGNSLLSRRSTVIKPRHVVAAPTDHTWTAPASEWASVEPELDIDSRGIVNEFAKEPDSSRWWKGQADLSAAMWLRADRDRLYVVIAVTDDVHRAAGADKVNAGDAALLRLSDGKTLTRIALPAAGGVPLIARGNEVFRPATAGQGELKVERIDRREGGVTWYRLSLARSLVAAKRLDINAQINDDDFGVHKQSLIHAPVDPANPGNTADWMKVILP